MAVVPESSYRRFLKVGMVNPFLPSRG